MNRRKFIRLGGIISAGTAVAGVSTIANEPSAKPLPKFENGRLLTADSLNAMIDRINELEARTHGK